MSLPPPAPPPPSRETDIVFGVLVLVAGLGAVAAVAYLLYVRTLRKAPSAGSEQSQSDADVEPVGISFRFG